MTKPRSVAASGTHVTSGMDAPQHKWHQHFGPANLMLEPGNSSAPHAEYLQLRLPLTASSRPSRLIGTASR